MAYPNTKIIRYKDVDDGKEYDGVFVEQSRTEITLQNSVQTKLVNEGISEETAIAVAGILKAEGII